MLYLSIVEAIARRLRRVINKLSGKGLQGGVWGRGREGEREEEGGGEREREAKHGCSVDSSFTNCFPLIFL